jgi:hypothetical protein
MIAQAFERPAAPYVHPRGRHMGTDRRRTLTDPAGLGTIVRSLAFVISVACRWLPADLAAARSDSEEAA